MLTIVQPDDDMEDIDDIDPSEALELFQQITDIALDHYSIQYLIDIIRQTAEIRRAGAN